MSEIHWSVEHLKIIHGLFYCRPLTDCEKRSTLNISIARHLGRTTGSVDFQWRHFANAVRHPIPKTTKKIIDLAKERMDDPIDVVCEARQVASDLGFKSSSWFPRPSLLDQASFGSTCVNKDDIYVDPILFRLVWRKPVSALLKESYADVFPRLGEKIEREPSYLRNRARTIYAVINNIELGNKKLDEARLETFPACLPVKNDLKGRGCPLDDWDHPDIKWYATTACIENKWLISRFL